MTAAEAFAYIGVPVSILALCWGGALLHMRSLRKLSSKLDRELAEAHARADRLLARLKVPDASV